MNSNKEQQKLNQASAAMLQKMAAWVDQQLADEEARRQLEIDYQSRCVKVAAGGKVNADE